jgi:hypothetical protein
LNANTLIEPGMMESVGIMNTVRIFKLYS